MVVGVQYFVLKRAARILGHLCGLIEFFNFFSDHFFLQVFFLKFTVKTSFIPIPVVVKLTWTRLRGKFGGFYDFPIRLSRAVYPCIIDIINTLWWFAWLLAGGRTGRWLLFAQRTRKIISFR